MQRHVQWIWRSKVLETKIRSKRSPQEKTLFLFYERSLCEKCKPKKDWECRLAESSQSEPFETKINEDKKTYLIAAPKGPPSPDYNASTYANSVWWRYLKCGDFVTGGFDNLSSDSLFWPKLHQQ